REANDVRRAIRSHRLVKPIENVVEPPAKARYSQTAAEPRDIVIRRGVARRDNQMVDALAACDALDLPLEHRALQDRREHFAGEARRANACLNDRDDGKSRHHSRGSSSGVHSRARMSNRAVRRHGVRAAATISVNSAGEVTPQITVASGQLFSTKA